MRPSSILVKAAAIWFLLGIAAAFSPKLYWIWLGWGLGLLILGLLDFFLLLITETPTVERDLPGRFALGVPQTIRLLIRNQTRRPIPLTVADALPDHAETEQLPWTGTLPTDERMALEYEAKLLRRGEQHFHECHLLLGSPFRLWQRGVTAGESSTTKVYPNYEPVIRYALLATSNRENQMGIRHRNRPGNSKEFHQLRDYHDGDQLQQIDWKATSRRMQLISREYREQRDQNIVLLLDSGRRMRAMDGELSQFDHCLNATLLLSFIALRQGDKVGVQAFGGSDRWLPPVKGQTAMTAVLNHVYDYQTTLAPGDIREACEVLMTRQRRRALIVVLTNLRSEDASDLIPSLQMLQRRHLVIIANLRERVMEDRLNTPVETLEDALSHTATRLYDNERDTVLQTLRSHGVITVNCSAQDLPVVLANEYLDIKKSGRL